MFYKEYKNTKKEISVLNILEELELKGEEGEHDAEVDAHNTMIEFKEILNKLGFSLLEMVELCPNVKDRTENFIVSSIKQNKENKDKIGEKQENLLKNWRKLQKNIQKEIIGL